MTTIRNRGGRVWYWVRVQQVQAPAALARRLAAGGDLVHRAVQRARCRCATCSGRTAPRRRPAAGRRCGRSSADVVTIAGRWRSLPASRSRTSSTVDRRDVPLGEHDQRGAARLARLVGHGQVALGDALGRVDQHERDVGPLGRLQRAHLAVVLDPLPVLALAPQAGRVDQPEPRVAAANGVSTASRVVPGGVGRRSPAAGPRIAFSSDDLPTLGRPRMATRISSSADPPAAPRRSICVEPLDDRVQQVAGRRGRGAPRPSSGRPAPASAARARRPRCSGVVHLVGDHQHRPAATGAGSGRSPRPRRPGRRRRRSPAAPGRPPRRPCRACVGDLRLHRRLVAGVDAAGVDQHESAGRSTRTTPRCGRG